VATPPADHAQRVERSTLTLTNVCIAMLADLPYFLQAGAASRNSLVTPRTSPYTPNDLVLHTPPQIIPFPFGGCCMVLSPDDRRHKLAIDSDAYKKTYF
jgi:hypothetical protein